MILFEFLIYLIIIIIDAMIMYLLQIFNPYYGSNSPEYALKVLDTFNEIQNLDPTTISGKKYFEFVNDRLKIIHHCTWHMIVHG